MKLTIISFAIFVLALIGLVNVIVSICVGISNIFALIRIKKLRKEKLKKVSMYCDTHNIPISAERQATKLILNDYPMHKVWKMIKNIEDKMEKLENNES